VAIIENDKVVYLRAFGVCKQGDATRVDEPTLFAIGSANRGFTTASLGMLVDAGKINWDDPVTKNLPGVQRRLPSSSEALEQKAGNRL